MWTHCFGTHKVLIFFTLHSIGWMQKSTRTWQKVTPLSLLLTKAVMTIETANLIILWNKMSHVMRLWHFSSIVNSFFKCKCADTQGGQMSDFRSDPSSTSILHVYEQRWLWWDCADAQARLSLRWSPEPSLVANVLSTITSWASSNHILTFIHVQRFSFVNRPSFCRSRDMWFLSVVGFSCLLRLSLRPTRVAELCVETWEQCSCISTLHIF